MASIWPEGDCGKVILVCSQHRAQRPFTVSGLLTCHKMPVVTVQKQEAVRGNTEAWGGTLSCMLEVGWCMHVLSVRSPMLGGLATFHGSRRGRLRDG